MYEIFIVTNDKSSSPSMAVDGKHFSTKEEAAVFAKEKNEAKASKEAAYRVEPLYVVTTIPNRTPAKAMY